MISLTTAAAVSYAIDARQAEASLAGKVVTLPQLSPKFDATQVKLYLTTPTWTLWNQAHGGKWTAQYDLLTGHPRRVFGGAIPWTSNAANLESVARAFIDSNQSVIGVPNSRLRFVPEASVAVKGGKVRYAAFDYEINGVPVEFARLVFAVNNGNMIYWHSANIANVPAVTSPAISSTQALANLLSYAGVSESLATVVKQPELKLIPRNTASLITYQLVYDAAFRVNGGRATWAALVDATTGAVIAFGDSNRYADGCGTPGGRVTGGIRPAQSTDAEVVRSFPFVRVDPGAATTSQNGTFPYAGGTVTTGLNGTFFDTNCTDCVKSEVDPQSGFQPFASSSNGLLALGTGGRDVVTPGQPTIAYGNGTSTPADRTAFFHTNVARAIALKWLDLPWLQAKVDVNVNINDVCNAFWDGSALNFFKAGELTSTTGSGYKCTNTGEIRDVMQHEWGHGLDDNDGEDPGYAAGLGDMATGEAAADYIALFVDHDSCIGQSFYNRFSGPFISDPDTMAVATCDGVRNVDELRASRGTLTATNVTQKCAAVSTAPYYIGPLLGEGHCEGELWGQVGWHLIHALSTGRKYGTATLDANKQHFTYAGDPLPNGPDGSPNPAFDRDTAWTILERLYFESRPLVASYAPTRYQAMGPSAYDGFVIVDDEGDGLANGTPHGAYINDAYVHHGVEEWSPATLNAPMSGDAKNCTPLAPPTVNVAQTISGGEPAVTVSWTPVAGATSYSVLRNERRHDVFLELARVTGTTFTDAGLDNGVTYNYRVQANGAGACYAVSGAVKTLAVSAPQISARSITITDSPRGNGDATLDAGERAQLYIALGNSGLSNLTNATATLVSSTPGITVTKAGPRTYGTIAVNGASSGSGSYTIELDATGALCGTEARLALNVTSDQGCFSVPITLPIGNAASTCVVYRSAYAQPASVAITSDQVGACGDGDKVPDPGETIQITVAVNNSGDRTANGVTVRLSADQSYLSIANATIDVGTLAPLGSETRTVTFSVVVGNAPHADTATFTATVTSSGSAAPATRALSTVVNRDLVLRTQSYDFESGEQGWTASANGWHRTTAPTTGNMTTVWQSNYVADHCDSLTSPAFEVSPTSALAFDIAHVTEYDGLGYDGADVQISIDGGNSWSTLEVNEGYPAAAAGTSNCFPAGTPMFAGPAPLMKRYTVDLSPFAGRNARLRFRFVADPLADATVIGAWLDNITTTNLTVSVPDTPCQ